MNVRNEPNDLTAIIEQKEGRSYILRFTDGQELKVPIFHFSKQIKIGDTIHLHFLTDQEAKQEKTKLAQALLEEILNG